MADKRSIWDMGEQETLAALVEQVGACTEAVNTYGSLVGKLAGAAEAGGGSAQQRF